MFASPFRHLASRRERSGKLPATDPETKPVPRYLDEEWQLTLAPADAAARFFQLRLVE